MIACALLTACGNPEPRPAANTVPIPAGKPSLRDGVYAFRVRRVDSLDAGKLTLTGASATLELDGREPPDVPTPTQLDQWPSVMSATMRGTASWTGDELVVSLTVEGASRPLDLTCRAMEIQVAPADAILVVAAGSTCKEPSVWSKPLERTWVLQCKSRAGLDCYGPTPGIEQVKSGLSTEQGCDPDVPLYRRVRPNTVAPMHAP